MGPPSYTRSVVDRNVVMRRMTVLCGTLSVQNTGILKEDDITSPHVIKTSYKFRRVPAAAYHSHRNRPV